MNTYGGKVDQGVRFTNVFSPVIQIQWKFHLDYKNDRQEIVHMAVVCRGMCNILSCYDART